MLPQVWHSPQRPTQRTDVQPHSVHRYVARACLAMAVTLSRPADSSRRDAQFGPEGTTCCVSSGSDAYRARIGHERHGLDARVAVGGGEVDADAVEHRRYGFAPPVLDTLPLAGDLDVLESHGALDTDLAPLERATVGEVPKPCHGRTVEPRLERREVVDGHDPAQPATTQLGSRTDGLTVRGLVGCRVVEHLDDLQIAVIGERDEPHDGAEPRVDPAVAGLDAERLLEPFRLRGEPSWSDGVDDMIDVHAPILVAVS